MMRVVRKTLNVYAAAILIATFVGGAWGALAQPATANAACGTFLTFPAWYDGLPMTGDCEIDMSAIDSLDEHVVTIIFNVVEIGFQIAGYMAGFFVIYGGIQFIISAGSSDGTAKARKTITNALIGLILAVAAVGIVNLVAGVV